MPSIRGVSLLCRTPNYRDTVRWIYFKKLYPVFLSNCQCFKGQMRVVKRNTQNLTGNTQPFSLGRIQISCSPNPNFLRVGGK